MSASKSKLWEQLTGEGNKVYGVFTTYCELGPNRSLKDLVRRIDMDLKELEFLRKKYNWDKRAKSYDKSHITEEDILQAKRQSEINKRVHDIRLQMIDRAEKMLKYPLTKQQAVKDVDGKETILQIFPQNWKPSDAIRLTKAAMELGKMVGEMGEFDESLLNPEPEIAEPPEVKPKRKRKKKVLKK